MNIKISVVISIIFIAAGLEAAQELINVSPGINQISSAMATAQPGDIIELAEGVYWETSTLHTIAGDLTIRGAENAEAIIYGPTEV